MTVTKVKAGIIGLGVGEKHIDGYRASDAAEVIALCDSDPAKRDMAKKKYPDCRVYDNAEALIDDPDVTVVSVASYDHQHAAQVVRALDCGKHVFSEKPLCTSEEDYVSIRRALVRNPGRRLSTNTVLRMSERFRDVHARIRAGDLGQLYCVEADYNYGRLHKVLDGWRGDIADYSVMLGGGVHMVDLLLWLTGSGIVEVSAVGNKICSAGAKFTTPDMVVAWLKFGNGAIGKVGVNFGCVQPHFHRVLLYGTKATFENALPSALLYRSRDASMPPEKIESAYPGVDKGDLLPSFVDAILGRGLALVEEADVFAAMSACLAIERSLRTGKPEHVRN